MGQAPAPTINGPILQQDFRSVDQVSKTAFEENERGNREKHQALRIPRLLFPVDQQSERLNTAREKWEGKNAH